MKTLVATLFLTLNALSQTVTVNVDPSGTYLVPATNDPANAATVIIFADHGINSGDTLLISRSGDYEARPGFGDVNTDMLSVLSDGNDVFSPAAGSTVLFPFNTNVSDIPEDFFVQQSQMEIVIPSGATQLSFTTNDTLFSDNTDPNNDFTVTIEVLNSGNTAPTLTSINQLQGAREATPFAIDFATLLAASDANDVDGDTLSFVIQQTLSGTLTLDGTPVAAGTEFSAGQTLTFTPDTVDAVDAFTVLVTDGDLDSASEVTVSINVKDINQRKIARLERKIKRLSWKVRALNHKIKFFNKLLNHTHNKRKKAFLKRLIKRSQKRVERLEKRIQKLEDKIQQELNC